MTVASQTPQDDSQAAELLATAVWDLLAEGPQSLDEDKLRQAANAVLFQDNPAPLALELSFATHEWLNYRTPTYHHRLQKASRQYERSRLR
jgi:hypothetical protein